MDRSRSEDRGGVRHMEAKVSVKNVENVFACAFSTFISLYLCSLSSLLSMKNPFISLSEDSFSL
jgi:hypothetical protein